MSHDITAESCTNADTILPVPSLPTPVSTSSIIDSFIATPSVHKHASPGCLLTKEITLGGEHMSWLQIMQQRYNIVDVSKTLRILVMFVQKEGDQR